MHHVPLFNGAKLGRLESNESRGGSFQGHKLHFVGLIFPKHMHDRSHIAFFQGVLDHRFGKNHNIEFSCHK